MRRSTRLIAAAWLSALGACAHEPPPKAPRPRAPVAESVPTRGGGAGSSRAHQATARDDRAAHAGPSSEQLSQRYARSRALTVQHGSASYYSDAFAGRSTASGAPYHPREFTAAHRSFAFGTILRVTRSDGGSSVYVRVTDRGPFGPRGRIVDLSRAAAEQLGMVRAGVVKVKVEVVEYGPKRTPRRRRR